MAEVLARYFTDVSLHSYDPAAAGASKRLVNWGLLEKALKVFFFFFFYVFIFHVFATRRTPSY